MAGDPNWSYVVGLLPMNDVGLTDVMGHNTVKNEQATRSATQSKWGGYSAYFDGSDDTLAVAASADWSFTTAPFTVEAWVYIAANSGLSNGGVRYAMVFSCVANNGFALGITGSSTTTGTGLYWEDKYGGASISGSWVASLSQGAWHHVCACRSGATVYLGLDGTVSATSVTGGAERNMGGSVTAYIGGQPISGYKHSLSGYIDDVRITKGLARYTADYTVPDAPFAAYKNYIAGTLTEASDHDEFTIRTHRLDTGAFLSEVTATGSSYEVGCCPLGTKNDYAGAVMVSAWPKMGAKWVANTAYTAGTYVYPTDPATTPYIFKCTTAGTSHSTTEPTWDDTPSNTTSDGSVTWTCQGRMLQPILHGPLTPSG
jgi:hypothetical protein